jgi:hypothetical protein
VQYPRDCGVSAIRFELGDPTHPLARAAADAITVLHHDTGQLICHCRFDGFWSLCVTKRWAVLVCTCNGSSLPLYIGPPPDVNDPRARAVRCACGESRHSAGVAIGYPTPAPPLGSIEAERAQEIAVALRCTPCGNVYLGWHLRLPKPYPVKPGDPWLRAIQGRLWK